MMELATIMPMANTYSWFNRKRSLVVEALLWLIVPMIVLGTVPGLGFLRYVLMVGGIGYLAMVLQRRQMGKTQVGITRMNLRISGYVSLGMAILISLVSWFGYYYQSVFWRNLASDMKVFTWPLWLIIVTYAFISVPLQEIVFRGLLIPRLEMAIGRKWIVIGISAALFGLAHAVFGNIWLVVATCLVGLFWSWLFVNYRNLFSIISSHAVVGSVFILLMNI